MRIVRRTADGSLFVKAAGFEPGSDAIFLPMTRTTIAGGADFSTTNRIKYYENVPVPRVGDKLDYSMYTCKTVSVKGALYYRDGRLYQREFSVVGESALFMCGSFMMFVRRQ